MQLLTATSKLWENAEDVLIIIILEFIFWTVTKKMEQNKPKHWSWIRLCFDTEHSRTGLGLGKMILDRFLEIEMFHGLCFPAAGDEPSSWAGWCAVGGGGGGGTLPHSCAAKTPDAIPSTAIELLIKSYNTQRSPFKDSRKMERQEVRILPRTYRISNNDIHN